MNKLPKRVFTFWYQGIEKAPKIVKTCMISWKELNPTWEVVFLDAFNINDYVEFDFDCESLSEKSIALKSDLLRLKLLSKHGGVWVDATVLCVLPLDAWIDSYTDNNLFLFSRPFKDRLFSSWFIASCKQNYAIEILYKELYLYSISTNYKQTPLRKKVSRVFELFLSKNILFTTFWFSSLLRNILKITPYLAIHYKLYQLVKTDSQIREEISKIKYYPAKRCHELMNAESKIQINDIIASGTPVQKLTYKRKNVALENFLTTYVDK